jgi:hypothetical protein
VVFTPGKIVKQWKLLAKAAFLMTSQAIQILPTSHRKISANFFQKLGILEGPSKITGM